MSKATAPPPPTTAAGRAREPGPGPRTPTSRPGVFPHALPGGSGGSPFHSDACSGGRGQRTGERKVQAVSEEATAAPPAPRCHAPVPVRHSGDWEAKGLGCWEEQEGFQETGPVLPWPCVCGRPGAPPPAPALGSLPLLGRSRASDPEHLAVPRAGAECGASAQGPSRPCGARPRTVRLMPRTAKGKGATPRQEGERPWGRRAGHRESPARASELGGTPTSPLSCRQGLKIVPLLSLSLTLGWGSLKRTHFWPPLTR